MKTAGFILSIRLLCGLIALIYPSKDIFQALETALLKKGSYISEKWEIIGKYSEGGILPGNGYLGVCV